MINDPGNFGQSDSIVSLCNVISSNGKKLNDIFKEKAFSTVVFTESMGLFKGDPQFISGEIVLIDAVDMLNEMNIKVDDTIELKFKTPQKKVIDFMGKVFYIDLSSLETKRAITLKFCSTEKIVADQIKIDKWYSGEPYSEIVRNIFSPLKKVDNKEIYTEKTKNLGNLILNGKSPVEAINLIKQAAKSSEYYGANYVFFEQCTSGPGGRFNFTSLERLCDPAKVEPTMIYYYDAPPEGAMGSVKGLVRMKNYRVVGTPNLINNIKSGAYAGTTISNDLMKRKITYTNYNYDKDFTKTKHVNHNTINGRKTFVMDNETYSQSRQSHVRFVPKHFSSFDTDTNHADEIEDTALVRRSQLIHAGAYRLQVLVPGDSNRRVGEIVKVILPAMEEKSDSSGGKEDKLLSGKYLISKIKHTIQSEPNTYDTRIDLVTDSLGTPLPARG